MSNFTKFLIKIGINTASVEAIGGRLVGVLSGLNSTNAGGYMEPNKIDGYTFNEADGRWYGYPPSPDNGTFGWFDPADASKQAELNQQRYWRELNNHVEHASPAQGEAGDLFSPSLWDLLRKMPEIIDRYREIAPDIWRDLKEYFSPLIVLNADGVDPTTNTLYNLARIPRPVDPLVLDLDGDGIETVGIQPGAAVLFDHDADGIKTGSGWVKADDGILVLDLDGNGQIETGRELFGDQTLVQSGANAGQRAANGLAALAQHDTNADSRIDSADAIYGQLQVWQDLNQDGISQSGELHSLSQLGIASLQVSGTPSNTALQDATTGMASGNTLQASASFTRVDGSTGVSGCTARRWGRSRAKTGISPRGMVIVCYRTGSKRRGKDWRGLAPWWG